MADLLLFGYAGLIVSAIGAFYELCQLVGPPEPPLGF